MRKIIIAVAFGFSLTVAGFGAAQHTTAAPIACPPAQDAVHTSDGGWFCQNPAGNPDASERPKH